MRFHIAGLDPAPFAPLFTDPAALAAHRGRRVVATEATGFPCRVSLEDARPGDELVLCSFEHLPTPSSPYHGIGPIYVRRDATRFAGDAIPAMLRSRQLSVRAYDVDDRMVAGELCPGTDVEPVIERMLDHARVRYLHLHFAATGCFACRVDRAEDALPSRA